MSNWSEAVAALPLRMICAWCKGLICAGKDPVSHGICPTCVSKMNLPETGD